MSFGFAVNVRNKRFNKGFVTVNFDNGILDYGWIVFAIVEGHVGPVHPMLMTLNLTTSFVGLSTIPPALPTTQAPPDL